MAEIVVEASAIKQLAKNIDKAKRSMIGQLAERGYQLLRAEVPELTGNLKQGVGSPDVDYDNLTALLTVSARSGETGSRTAEVFDSKGKLKKKVSLRPSPAYNYAEVVARGNREATLTPSHARAFLIPVTSAPSGEGYLMVGGQIYIVRRSRKGKAANPYDERAATRLENEAPAVGNAVLKKYFNGE